MTKIYDMEDIERRLSALEGKKDIIKCPIEIEMFNNMYYIQNERQNLSYEPSDNIWRVSWANNLLVTPCQLIKTTFEDLETWDVFYGSDCGLEGINNIENYGVKIGDQDHALWHDEWVCVWNYNHDDIYKVTKI